jgi:hypothetical protein
MAVAPEQDDTTTHRPALARAGCTGLRRHVVCAWVAAALLASGQVAAHAQDPAPPVAPEVITRDAATPRCVRSGSINR